MYQRKSGLQSLVIMLLDCGSIIISLMIANYIRNGRFFFSDNERMDFGLLLGSCLVVYLLISIFLSSGKSLYHRGPLHELLLILQTNFLMFAGGSMILFMMHLLDAYSRLVFAYFLIADTILMFSLHQLFKKSLPFLYKSFREIHRILLISDLESAPALVADMEAIKGYSYELIGIALLDEDHQEQAVMDLPVVAGREDLIEYCKAASLDEVILVNESSNKQNMLEQMEILAEMGITIHYHINVPDLKSAGHKSLSKFGRFDTVTYANKIVPAGQVLLKRLMDIVGAFIGCFILLILTIFLGPAIRLESPGPIFFGQKRVGRNGRIFKMYKFRSMYADAEERKKELMAQNEMNGLMFKMENDPRITKVGRFIRKTSLDEFPQFINILKGDMSLVGTRPPTLDEFSNYSPYHKKRLSFRPGLTGMWQVSGRSDITDFEEIVRLDVEYIDNWSIFLDFKILLKTFLAVFKGNGAK